jgi:hypothetical protein
MIRMWAAEIYMGHWDGYAPTINNYHLHSDGTGRFSMLPWGTDQTWGSDWDFHSGAGYLFARCMWIAECRSRYDAALVELVDAIDGLDLDSLAADVAAVLDPWAELDPRRPFWIDDVRWNVQWTRDFMANRRAQVQAMIDCLASGADADGDGFDCTVDCNDADPATHPGAVEVCSDGLDQDCTGVADDGIDCPDCVERWLGTHRYLACTTPRPWDLAREHCLALGADMVVLDDADEQAEVWAFAASVWDTSWWLGLTDAAEEGTFVWIDGSAPAFTSWSWGEPNDWGGVEDCAQIFAGPAWNDLDCAAPQPVLCEEACEPGTDADGDGFDACREDCDDADPGIYPGATDLCGDGIDQDCSGMADDALDCLGCASLIAAGAPTTLCDAPLPQQAAARACGLLGFGCSLAWFESLDDQTGVRDSIDRRAPGAEVWIGLDDIEEEGTFLWADGSAPSYVAWAAGQPNDAGGTQDCVRMLGDGTWNDSDCALLWLMPLCRCRE